MITFLAAHDRVFEMYTRDALRALTKGQALPRDAVALAYIDGEAQPRLVRSGAELPKHVERLLVFTTQPISVPTGQLVGLRSRDGFLCVVSGTLTFVLEHDDPDSLADFYKAVASSDEVTDISRDDLWELVQQKVYEAFKGYTLEREMATLQGASDHAASADVVRKHLADISRDARLLFTGITGVSVYSAEFEKLRQDELDGERRQRELSIYYKIAREEKLSQQEFDEFVHGLAHERELAEYDRKADQLRAYLEYEQQNHDIHKALDALTADRTISIDRKHFDEKLAQAKAVRDALEDSPNAGQLILAAFEDDPVRKESIYRELIVNERLRAAKGLGRDEIEAALAPVALKEHGRTAELLEALISRIDVLIQVQRRAAEAEAEAAAPTPSAEVVAHSGPVTVEPVAPPLVAPNRPASAAEVRPVEAAPVKPVKRVYVAPRPSTVYPIVPPHVTHRVLIVVGKTVLAFDPRDPKSARRPSEIYDFSGHELGSLRSVRLAQAGDQRFLLAGARQGIYALPIEDKAAGEVHVLAFAYFTERVFKGGTNAAAIADNKLWATHSEGGIAWWPLTDPAHLSTPIFPALTNPSETVRALTEHNGRLFFAAGNIVHSFDSRNVGLEPDRVYTGSRSEITGVVVVEDYVYASNRDGKIFRWPIEGGERVAPQVEAQEPNPIYMLKHATIGGVGHLIEGAKQYGVTIKSLEASVSTTYRATLPIRWVDAAADYVAGVSADQMRLFIWNSANPNEPLMTIDAGDKIQDIVLWPDRA